MTSGIGGSTANLELASIQADLSDVSPISAAERQARVEKAARLMQENRVDAMILPAGSSLYYFTGLRWYPSERLTAAIITPDARLTYLCPAFEESKLRETLGTDADIRLWQEEDDPCLLIKTCLQDAGYKSAAIALDENAPFFIFDGLRRVLPLAQIVNAASITAECRMHKSAAELTMQNVDALPP